nr:hypothetical protein Iba_chr14aCG15370 [Ipomoea batatas]
MAALATVGAKRRRGGEWRSGSGDIWKRRIEELVQAYFHGQSQTLSPSGKQVTCCSECNGQVAYRPLRTICLSRIEWPSAADDMKRPPALVTVFQLAGTPPPPSLSPLSAGEIRPVGCSPGYRSIRTRRIPAAGRRSQLISQSQFDSPVERAFLVHDGSHIVSGEVPVTKWPRVLELTRREGSVAGGGQTGGRVSPAGSDDGVDEKVPLNGIEYNQGA